MHLVSEQPVSFSQALRYWLKLGFISFGGPAGQIALMHTELVERRRWISEQRFLHALNYCMLLPGPEATQLAVYIGWLLHRTRGGIAAGVLFVLGAAWRIGSRTLRNGLLGAIAACAFLAIAVFQLPFPLIVLGAAAAGFIAARLRPDLFRLGAAHAAAGKSYGPALIDDHTPTPAHARFSWAGLMRVALAGCAIGFAAWAVLALLYGPSGALAQMGWFFTKAAMLSFGGAYAVLPYVVQGAVEHYHWLSATQMIDGLALGETTPGPLIMIVAFVGFVGGWTHALFGPDAPLLAGAAGAATASLFTFLPSFIFILAGGPLVESTRGNVRMTAPLTAISAAVVGVIASLAVFFGRQVFMQGGAPQWQAIAIGLLATIAQLAYKLGTIKLILACAAASLVLSYWNG